jgi:hypothetical protein
VLIICPPPSVGSPESQSLKIFFIQWLQSFFFNFYFIHLCVQCTGCNVLLFFVIMVGEKLCIWVFFFYCCAGLEYIVAFTKVLTMYHIYHTWIHHLHCSPLSAPIPGIVSMGIIFAFTYMCTHYLQVMFHIFLCA